MINYIQKDGLYLESIINSIKSKARSGIHPGLENIALLCKELGNIQDTLKFIHVAGTNGKGSVCAFCESILSNAGIKTGCYTSPCVFEKTEQFRINCLNCSSDVLKKAAHIVLDAVDRINTQGFYPSEFEIETAIAFEIFYLEKCDICIVECGMGGLLDATNVIKNTIVSVLTPIAKDHTAFLGDTLTKISENKCGIIKNDSSVVSANQHNEAEYIIKEKCRTLNIAPLFIDNSHITDIVLNDMVMDFSYKNIRYSTRLIGIHQTHNAALATEACLALKRYGYNLTDDDIKNGILNAKNPGRFEILSSNPLVICDGAHNIHGAEALKNTINEFFCDKEFNIVMGVFKDKDYNGILAILSEISDCIITVEPKGERALDKNKLCDTAKEYFKSAQISDIDSVVDKIRKSDKAYCICGSLSYLNDFKNSFYKKK